MEKILSFVGKSRVHVANDSFVWMIQWLSHSQQLYLPFCLKRYTEQIFVMNSFHSSYVFKQPCIKDF